MSTVQERLQFLKKTWKTSFRQMEKDAKLPAQIITNIASGGTATMTDRVALAMCSAFPDLSREWLQYGIGSYGVPEPVAEPEPATPSELLEVFKEQVRQYKELYEQTRKQLSEESARHKEEISELKKELAGLKTELADERKAMLRLQHEKDRMFNHVLDSVRDLDTGNHYISAVAKKRGGGPTPMGVAEYGHPDLK